MAVERQRRGSSPPAPPSSAAGHLAELGKLGVDLQHVRHQVAVGEHPCPFETPVMPPVYWLRLDILQARPDRLQGGLARWAA